MYSRLRDNGLATNQARKPVKTREVSRWLRFLATLAVEQGSIPAPAWNTQLSVRIPSVRNPSCSSALHGHCMPNVHIYTWRQTLINIKINKFSIETKPVCYLYPLLQRATKGIDTLLVLFVWCECMSQLCRGLWKPEDSIRSLRITFTEGCDLPSVGAGNCKSNKDT